MNILLTGKTGQVGLKLLNELKGYNVIALDRAQMDLSNPLKVRAMLEYYKPDIIINAGAYTAVDKAESEHDIAFKVNSDAVFEMGQYARYNSCRVYHYSTDYVFDGQSSVPYKETDKASPLNAYGASKLAGERALVDSGCNFYIFRTSWVYSDLGHNFIKTILKLLPIKEKLNIVNDQFGAPTPARLIAQITAKIISMDISKGIYHLTTTGFTSWYELAKIVAETFYGTEIAKKIMPISSEGYPFIAKRPPYSVLNTSLLESTLNERLPTWQDELTIVLEKILLNKKEFLL